MNVEPMYLLRKMAVSGVSPQPFHTEWVRFPAEFTLAQFVVIWDSAVFSGTCKVTVETTWDTDTVAQVGSQVTTGTGTPSPQIQEIRKDLGPLVRLLVEPVSGSVIVTAVLTPKLGSNLVPAGTIALFGGSSAAVPSGWLLCDGSTVLITDYPALYAVLANTFGGSPPSFVLPDLRDRFAQGVGPLNALGSVGGSQGHNHAVGAGSGKTVLSPTGITASTGSASLSVTAGGASLANTTGDPVTVVDPSHDHGTVVDVNADTRPEFQTINYIVKT